MKQQTIKYLRCDIFEGMFSSEKGVEFEDVDGKPVSGFFPNEFIKGDKLEIKVVRLGKDNSLICAPFPDSGGYGFFQGSCFYVNNNLLSDSFQIAPAIAPIDYERNNSKPL